MPIPNWDKVETDRWDRDFSGFCRHHGKNLDRYGDCPTCISLDDPHVEERMELKKAREMWAKQVRLYEESKLEPLMNEEEWLAYRKREEENV